MPRRIEHRVCGTSVSRSRWCGAYTASWLLHANPPEAPLRLTPLARGLPAHGRRSLLVVHDALERILQQQTTLLPFEDVYRAGAVAWRASTTPCTTSTNSPCGRSAAFRANARASRAACFTTRNLYSERARFSRGVTSVLRMGTHACRSAWGHINLIHVTTCRAVLSTGYAASVSRQ